MSELTLNLVVSSALEALEYYEVVFGGERLEVYDFPESNAYNEANLKVGGVKLRLIDENPEFECYPPKVDEVDSIWLQIMVEDVEGCLAKAVELGGTLEQAIQEFMGTLNGQFKDPFGYTWTVNKIIREVSYQERYDFYMSYMTEE